MKIGIPRTFFFYYYFPFWSVFFKSLGFELTVSPATNLSILEEGIERTLDEYCLPVKIHRGHVAWLEGQCDFIFSPGYGRNGSKGFFCPKLMGLPDLLRTAHDSAVTFWHDLNKDGCLDYKQWLEAIRKIDSDLSEKKIALAWKEASTELNQYLLRVRQGVPLWEALSEWTGERSLCQSISKPRYRLALLGHPYLVYDPWISGRLLETLHKYQAEVVFQENIPEKVHGEKWPFQRKKVYWPVGQETLSAAQYYLQQPSIDGIIQISSCLCGPDAIVGELLGKYMHQTKRNFPLLQLTIDEHTGWAGLQTRIEAFMDLLDWGREHASL